MTNYERPQPAARLTGGEREQLLREYYDEYARLSASEPDVLNRKVPREHFRELLGQVGALVQQEAARMAREAGPVRDFLDDRLYEMDDINEEFARTDVVLVIGANDVVNPAARTDTSSPIYGMPILNVDHAKNIIVLKRSMAAGYSGVENELFYHPRTTMLFGDAKKSIEKLAAEVKAL
jgi:hypothetical protein